MEPVKSNVKSKRTGNPIGTDDVIFQGGLPCLNFCEDTSLTDVLVALGSQFCNQYGAYAPGMGCVTGNWVDISGAMTQSGTGYSYSWYIANMGGGVYNDITAGNPSYKWTVSGDLQFKGSFSLEFVAGALTGTFVIPLITLPANCFPLGFNCSQAKFLTTWNRGTVNIGKVFFNLDYATRQLQLVGDWTYAATGFTASIPITLSATIFNIN